MEEPKAVDMNNQPAKKFRVGYVTATVWENESGDKKFFAVNLSRSYKDGDDWKNTDQLGAGDLMNAMRVLDRAEQWIADQE